MNIADKNTVDVHLNKRIEASDIQSSDFSLTPRGDYRSPGLTPGEPEIQDIQVSHNTENLSKWTTVRLTTTSLDLSTDYAFGIHNRSAIVP